MKPKNHLRCGERIWSDTVSDFEKWAIELDHINKDRQDFQKFWIVPAQFCASRFINDPRLIAGELQEDPVRTATVNFEILSDIKTVDHLMSHCAMNVVATRNIARGDDIFLNYVPTYFFPNAALDLSDK